MEEAAGDEEEERKEGRLKMQQRAALDLSFPPSLVFGLLSSCSSRLEHGFKEHGFKEHGFKEHGFILVGQAGFPFATDISSVRCLQPDRPYLRQITLPCLRVPFQGC